MAITSRDGILAARASGAFQDIFSWLTATLGGVTTSWYFDNHTAKVPAYGGTIAHTTFATGGAIRNAASTGCAFPWTVAGGTNKRYLHELTLNASSLTGVTALMLIDTLWEGSAVNISTNATFNCTTQPTLTRYSGTAAAGNMILIEVSSAFSATTQATVTINYTDDTGTSRSTSFLTGTTSMAVGRIMGNCIPASATVNNAMPFVPLAAGSAGVRSIQSLVTSGGATVVGQLDVSIVRPLLLIPIDVALRPVIWDGLLELAEGTDTQHGWLSGLWLTGGTTAISPSLFARTIEG